ncbi:hypothetical protein [Kitasatospora sp. NPDC090091]|uniref:hypothetical protein n=1 Tax=Kitasatospora sp. NPDC090091 TaxID=3364081 RepID=UPI0037FAFBF0
MSVARRRRRLPDEVRVAVVRAVLCLAFTLVGLLVAALASYADSWLLTPALMAMGLGVFGTMWCLLEILISRQVAAQRVRGPNAASPMAGSRAAAPVPPPQPRPLPHPQPRPHPAAPPARQPQERQQQARQAQGWQPPERPSPGWQSQQNRPPQGGRQSRVPMP